MPEATTTTCPLCGLLAVRLCVGAQSSTGGWGSKWVCYNDAGHGGKGRWQSQAADLPRPVEERECKRLWAMLNTVPLFGVTSAELASALAVHVARQDHLDGRATRADLDAALKPKGRT